MLRAKGKDAQQMVRNIIPEGVECMLYNRLNSWALVTRFYVRNAVGEDPFAVLLADDMTDYERV